MATQILIVRGHAFNRSVVTKEVDSDCLFPSPVCLCDGIPEYSCYLDLNYLTQ